MFQPRIRKPIPLKSHAQVLGTETMRQKLVQCQTKNLLPVIRIHVNWHRSTKLANDLAANTTGANWLRLVTGNGNGLNLAMSFHHHSRYSRSFSANGGAIQGIFNVGSCNHLVAVNKQSTANTVG